MWYPSWANIEKTLWRYSKPLNRTDGFVSKNRKVIHLRTKSKLAFWDSKLTLKSCRNFQSVTRPQKNIYIKINTSVNASIALMWNLKSTWNMLVINDLFTPAVFICSLSWSTNSSLGTAKFHFSTRSLTSSLTRCDFKLFKGSNGEVSTSSSFLRLLLAAATGAPI